MSEVPSQKPNPFLGYETISKIMIAREKHLARIEQIEMDFDERLDAYTLKLYEIFQRADKLKQKHLADREQMITFNELIDEKMNKIFHVVPELENSSQSSEAPQQ